MLTTGKRSAPPSQSRASAVPETPSLKFADIAAAIEKRLFIGKVPPGTTEDEIRALYGPYGALTECRVVPDRSGGNSNGIAFVGFETWSATHRALLETDGKHKLRGHEGTGSSMVASFAERTSSVGRGGGLAYAKGMQVNRVFVGSLPDDCTESELIEKFSMVGAVDVATMLPAKGRRRCGYVSFHLWGEAMDAVERLSGEPLRAGGEQMTVVLAQPKEKDGGLAATTCRAAGLSQTAAHASEPPTKARRTDSGAGSSAMLSQLLTAYVAAVTGGSPATACELIHEQIMKTREKVQGAGPGAGLGGLMPKAVEGGRGSAWAPAPSFGSRGGADAGPGEVDKARLFVGGLPHDITDDDLASLAVQLSFPDLPPESCELLECRVLPGKGCGYLRYPTWEAAEEAYAALQGRQVEGWTQVLRLQWASPRGHQPPAPSAASPPSELAVGPDPLSFATQSEVEAQGLDPTRLFIGQIARDADAGSELKTLFEEYGQLQEFRWVQEKGVLYVSYAGFGEAQSALRGLGNRIVPGVSKGLNVKFSQRMRRH